MNESFKFGEPPTPCVLHLCPHLGGGVGKAVSSLVEESHANNSGFQHEVMLFEQPEKHQFVDQVRQNGGKIGHCNDPRELAEAIHRADIVQLEFWNHPAIPKMLCSGPLPEMRLLVWCHISGLYYPRIPPGLLASAEKFIFTSPCSLDTEESAQWVSKGGANLAVVSSGCRLDTLPAPKLGGYGKRFQAGYFGSLNFAKMHPDFVSLLSAVSDPSFTVRVTGDMANQALLEEQCHAIGRPHLLEFRGYTTDVAAEMEELDVLIYLLNPSHYGTAENTLLEAMALGVVPIVLNNSAEQLIVEHGVTGLVLESPGGLASAIDELANNREKRISMAKRAAGVVRDKFTSSNMGKAFHGHYRGIICKPKKSVPFREIFGNSPSEWFRAYGRDASVFRDNGEVCLPSGPERYIYLEPTKGSVNHFCNNFPSDVQLQMWLNDLQRQCY